MSNEKFGCHIILGEYSSQGNLYTGQFLMDSVEVRYCGQEGGTRSAILFDRMGNKGSGSFIKSSSIHNSYLESIFLKETNNVILENNVAYKSIRSTFRVSGSGHTIKGNLGIYTQERPQTNDQQVDVLATFEIRFGINTITDNVAVGSDDMGFIGAGSPCGTSYNNAIFKENVAHGCKMGFYFQKNSGNIHYSAITHIFRMYHFIQFDGLQNKPCRCLLPTTC